MQNNSFLVRGDKFAKIQPGGKLLWLDNQNDASALTPVEAGIWKLALQESGEQGIKVQQVERSFVGFLMNQEIEHPDMSFEDFINQRTFVNRTSAGHPSFLYAGGDHAIDIVTKNTSGGFSESGQPVFRLQIGDFTTESQNLRTVELKLYTFLGHQHAAKVLSSSNQTGARKVA